MHHVHAHTLARSSSLRPSRRPSPWPHSLSALALITFVVVSCTTDGDDADTEDALPSNVDPELVDTGLGGDTGAVADTNPVDGGAHADMPGTCFEVFGPEGISHSPPRVHDAGWVKVGASHEIGVNVYNFCGDPAARVLGVEVLEATPGLDVSTSGLDSGASIGIDGDLLTTVSPTVEGEHSATVRLAVSHGYYDFTIDLEASELVSVAGESCGTNMSLPCTAGTLCVQTMPEACDPMWWGTCEPIPGPGACDAAATVCDCDGVAYASACNARQVGGGEWLEPCSP